MKMHFFKSFTLLELLVVIAIILILASLLLPGLSAAKERAKSIQCAGNLKQMGAACLMYIDDSQNYLPAARNSIRPIKDANWKLRLSAYMGMNVIDSIAPPELGSGVFSCPSWKGVPEQTKASFYGGYGWNWYYMGYDASYTDADYGPQRIISVKIPSETALCGDTTDWSAQIHGVYLYSGGFGTGPNPSVGNRHQGGINLLWVDFHVSWNKQSTLRTGKNGNTNWYYAKTK